MKQYTGLLTALIGFPLIVYVALIIYTDLYIALDPGFAVVNYGQYMFQPYERRGVFSPGVFTRQDVCVEENPLNRSEKLLVLYNAGRTSHKPELLSADQSKNAQFEGWPVLYKQGPIPDQHNIADHPAFFMVMTCEGNLYHLIEDSLIGLYGLMEATGRIGKHKRNQIFSNACAPEKDSECLSRSRYRDLVEHLSGVPGTYGCLDEFREQNVCYRYAGFGFLPMADKSGFFRFLKARYDITDASCGGSSSGILLVERAYRRVLNMAELEEATRRLGLKNTRVERVDLATLTLEEQMRKVHCSHIMVGVQGAGLQWIYFLPPHSAVLEIGWKNWPRMYVDRGKPYGIKGSYLYSENVTINWEEYKNYNNLEELSDEQKEFVQLNIKGKFMKTNPYKYADTWVRVDEYLKHLHGLMEKLSAEGVVF